MIRNIRNRITGEEFDYQALLDALQQYARPRDKISDLLRRGEIIRIKKGIYIFGSAYARRPFSREILANMLYGPSYVSLDYALHYHGLIPERAEAVTSVTCGRNRRFATPVGLFIYRSVPLAGYAEGIDRVEIEGGRAFLMATREKALADRIRDDRRSGVRSAGDMRRYLLESLRIDPAGLVGMDSARLEAIAALYRSRRIRLAASVVRHPGGEERLPHE